MIFSFFSMFLIAPLHFVNKSWQIPFKRSKINFYMSSWLPIRFFLIFLLYLCIVFTNCCPLDLIDLNGVKLLFMCRLDQTLYFFSFLDVSYSWSKSYIGAVNLYVYTNTQWLFPYTFLVYKVLITNSIQSFGVNSECALPCIAWNSPLSTSKNVYQLSINN